MTGLLLKRRVALVVTVLAAVIGFTLVALLTDENGNSLFLKGEADQIAAAREDALEWLGPAVHEISEYWCAHANRTQPAKIDPFRKIGRNEPCPCGSGKKYKKCHGQAA